MNWKSGIGAWLLVWWIWQTIHLAGLYGTRSFEAGLGFWIYLTALILGRFAFFAARDALARWRQSRAAYAQTLAIHTDGREQPQGAVRS
jgi:hypothetical protein